MRRSIWPFYIVGGLLSGMPGFMGIAAEDLPGAAENLKVVEVTDSEHIIRGEPEITTLVVKGGVPDEEQSTEEPVKIVVADLPLLNSVSLQEIPGPVELQLEGNLQSLRRICIKDTQVEKVVADHAIIPVKEVQLRLQSSGEEEDQAQPEELKGKIKELAEENSDLQFSIQGLEQRCAALREYNSNLVAHDRELHQFIDRTREIEGPVADSPVVEETDCEER